MKNDIHCKKGRNTGYMVVNGHNYLLVKSSNTLNKAFERDWTVSFALLLPSMVNEFYGYFLIKGDKN